MTRIPATAVTAADAVTRSRSVTLAEPTADVAVIEAAALDLLERFTARRPVRLVGVRAGFAADGN